ncbi:MAG TPA: hypothetical protein EYQ31_03845 [Candidatus Handelsmanbacteria bacterium]|nr:hypothetical protein [Candidatus Handelsmanbacteria bacterium]
MNGSRLIAMALTAAWLSACASTSGSGSAYMPPPITEGQGRMSLQAAGINQLNFYVVDDATGEEVYEDMPRVSSRSPSAYDSGAEKNRLTVDLDPGTYTVVVNTDIEDDVVVEDVVVQMGQEVYVNVRVGRFQVNFQGGEGLSGIQMPFLIWDWNMSTVLGRGMTSSEVRRVIVPEGRYKIRMENSSSGFDIIKPVEVNYGRITQVFISTESQQQPEPELEQQN